MGSDKDSSDNNDIAPLVAGSPLPPWRNKTLRRPDIDRDNNRGSREPVFVSAFRPTSKFRAAPSRKLSQHIEPSGGTIARSAFAEISQISPKPSRVVYVERF